MLSSGVIANFNKGVIVVRVSYGAGMSGLTASAANVAPAEMAALVRDQLMTTLLRNPELLGQVSGAVSPG